MRLVLAAFLALTLPVAAQAVEFTVGFQWGDIPLCTSGRPNRVPSPEFILNGLPNGTTTVEFRLKDLDVPSFNHGGGKVKVKGPGKVPSGAFRYLSPCPPKGKHTYEWTAIARKGKTVVARATIRRKYPN